MTTHKTMNPASIEKKDLSNEVTVEIPPRLAVRVKKYAEENDMSFAGVVVEALDRLLR